MTCPATHPLCQHIRAHDMRRYGCTCEAARRARARMQKQVRLRRLRGDYRRVDPTGTIRRIQALAAIGWRQSDIAARLGCHQQVIAQILNERKYVHRETAAAIARIYDQLADHDGPSNLTRSRARAKGWLGPLWWDDDTIDDPTYKPPTRDRRRKTDVDRVAVDEAIAGRRTADHLTRAERLLAVTALRDRGLSLHQIGEHLAYPARSATRDLCHLANTLHTRSMLTLTTAGDQTAPADAHEDFDAPVDDDQLSGQDANVTAWQVAS